MPVRKQTLKELNTELEELRHQLYEANETIEAIRTGQVDALVVENHKGHQLYTLKTADHAYRVFIEKMTEGAVTLSTEGVILYCNSRFAAMTGLPLSHVIGLPFIQFLAPGSQDVFGAVFLNSWKEDCKLEVELTESGSYRPVLLSLTALELDDLTSLSVILTDLTAQKKAQQLLEWNNRQLAQMNSALEASNHDLQQFASVASHDLQEPLRKIQIFSNLLAERHAGNLNPDAISYIEKITASASRMKTLILDVLTYSKLSANDNAFEWLDLNAVVTELLEDFEMLIQEKGAVITVDPLPCLEANHGQMRQLFQNILSNALKFVKPGETPAIHISGKQAFEKSFTGGEQKEDAFCFLSIRDNGIGFDEKYVSNIFALFERLHGKDLYEGTGIGLAITKKIVEKHNGSISAKSRVGEGAEFLIRLPVKQSTALSHHAT